MNTRPGRTSTAVSPLVLAPLSALVLALVASFAGVVGPAAAASTSGPAAGPGSGTIAGRITDAAGGPVAGTWVTAMTADVSSAYAGRTDGTGRYRVDGITPGDYFLSFMVPGTQLVQYVPGKARPAAGRPYRVAAGAETVVDDVLLPTGTIVGHFTDQAGRPVPTRVDAVPVGSVGGLAEGATDDVDGGYQMPVFAGAYRVRFNAGSRTPQYAYRQFDPARAAVIEVAPGERVTVDDVALR